MDEIISERQGRVLNYLREHDIPFTCYNHAEGKTIEEAKRWWKDDGSVHCKNIFMRNHKGNQHYLIDHLRMNKNLCEFGVNGDEAGVMLFRYLVTAEIGADAHAAWQAYLDAWEMLNEKYKK